MVPSAFDIMDKRHRNRRRLRWFAWIFVVVGSMPLVYFAVGLPFTQYFDPYDFGRQLQWAAVFWAPALVMGVGDRWIARWLVPLPRAQCPKCGYALQRLTRAQCPECGFPVPARFVDQADLAHDDDGGSDA